MRELRAEQVQVCQVVHERLDSVRSSQDAIEASSTTTGSKVEGVTATLDDGVDVTCSGCAAGAGGTEDEPSIVKLAASDATQPTIRDAYKGGASLFLFGVGILAAVNALTFVFWRVVFK